MPITEIYSDNTIPDKLTFDSSNGQQVLIVSGSMYNTGTDATSNVAVSVDKKQVGTLKMCQNGTARHLTFPARLFPLQLAAGSHTLEFKKAGGVTSDVNDQFNVVLIDM